MTGFSVVREWKTGGENVMSLDAACLNIQSNGILVDGVHREVGYHRVKALLLDDQVVETKHAIFCLASKA